MEETNRVLNNGRYHCKRVLGEGSMGRTYLAVDTQSGMEVAVKALYPSRLATNKDLELFTREATTLQRLDHPQIPRYIDAFHEGEGESICYFLVQTYVEGKTLREIIDEGERFDEPQILAFIKEVIDVLEYMHSLDPKVVHRDVKPSNIIVFGEKRLPTLIDFGAVREVVRLTMGGGSTIIGTFGYMPPEQLMGRALPPTDLYALGITALECLTRRTPADLHGEDAARMIENLTASEGLKRILRRLCAPSLADRYETATQVRADLEAVQKNKALVHATQIESDVARRMREHQRQLAKETGIGIPILTFIVALMIGAALVLLAFFMIRTVAESIESGVAIASLITVFGACIPLGIKFKRYVHDAWSPPASDWIRTECMVGEVSMEWTVDPQTNQPMKAFFLNYEFRMPTGLSKHKFYLGRDPLERHYALENTVQQVYYRPGRPEAHEFLDFLHGNFDPESAHLFDHKVKHISG